MRQKALAVASYPVDVGMPRSAMIGSRSGSAEKARVDTDTDEDLLQCTKNGIVMVIPI